MNEDLSNTAADPRNVAGMLRPSFPWRQCPYFVNRRKVKEKNYNFKVMYLNSLKRIGKVGSEDYYTEGLMK
jgi:hypothetical protein